jgi:exonuclease SbcD
MKEDNMKLLHLADLHIGKRVNEFSMIPDQKYILEQILKITKEEKPDAILIAGDVYDKSQPSAEAVELLDGFLTRLTAMGQPIFIISGNHDSPERLSFGRKIMEKTGLHIAGTFDGSMQKVSLEDAHGPVHIYMLPFLKPAMVRPFFEEEIESYDQAVAAVISAANINSKERNVLIAHQFVVSGALQPERSESEALSVGGLDSVDASNFSNFDYVALGHLHRAQRMGRDTLRYAGSPLKYSFSEVLHKKSATFIELGAKGEEIAIHELPLEPLRDLREIKGPIKELIRVGREEGLGTAESSSEVQSEEGQGGELQDEPNQERASQDYIRAILTDEEEIYDALGQLRQVYPNLMALELENSRTIQQNTTSLAASGDMAAKSPLELFAEFYEEQNNNELTPEQRLIMEEILQQAGGAEE